MSILHGVAAQDNRPAVVFVGQATSTMHHIRAFSARGRELWSYFGSPETSGNDFRSVAMDRAGNTYVCGAKGSVEYPNILKFSPRGDILWSHFDTDVWHVYVNDDANRVVFSDASFDGGVRVRVHDLEMNVVANYTGSYGVKFAFVNATGERWHLESGSDHIIKYDASANVLWTHDFGQTITCAVLDGNDQIVVGGNSGRFRRYNSGGTVNLSGTLSGYISDVAVDLNGNICLALHGGVLRKLTVTGQTVFSVNAAHFKFSSVAVDNSGNIHAVYQSANWPNDNTMRSYTPSGVSFRIINHGRSRYIRSIATRPRR